MITKLFKNLFSKTEADATAKANAAEQNAKDYADTALTKRAWNFTTSTAASLGLSSDAFVFNNVAMGPVIFSNVTGTVNTYVTIGSTTDKPPVDFVLFPIYNGSTTNYIGVLRITQDGSVDIRVNTSTVSQSIYFNMLYRVAE